MKKLPIYLYKNRSQHIQGPMEELELKKLYLENQIHLDDSIYKEGNHWRLVRDDLELFHKTPEVSFFQKKSFLYLVLFIFFFSLLYLALS